MHRPDRVARFRHYVIGHERHVHVERNLRRRSILAGCRQQRRPRRPVGWRPDHAFQGGERPPPATGGLSTCSCTPTSVRRGRLRCVTSTPPRQPAHRRLVGEFGRRAVELGDATWGGGADLRLKLRNGRRCCNPYGGARHREEAEQAPGDGPPGARLEECETGLGPPQGIRVHLLSARGRAVSHPQLPALSTRRHSTFHSAKLFGGDLPYNVKVLNPGWVKTLKGRSGRHLQKTANPSREQKECIRRKRIICDDCSDLLKELRGC